MNRVSLNSKAWGLVLWSCVFPFVMQPSVHAITINMTYTDAGSTPPHPENPSWDPNGSILIAHFQAAKAIWEALLPGPGTFSFDFHWDDNIDGLALTTQTGADDFIEINPNQLWYADPSPGDNAEFSFADTVDSMGNPRFFQRFFSQLSPSDQSTYFPDTPPPGALEVMYRGFGLSSAVSASMQTTTDSMGNTVPVTARNGFDLLSTIVHEMGHILGIGGIEPGYYNILPQHVGGLENVNVLDSDEGGGHLAGNPDTPGFLMCDSCGQRGVRRFPSATDVLVIAEEQGITDVRLARVERISTGLWSDTNGWIGGAVPSGDQDVFIRHGGSVSVDVYASANNLLIAPGNSLFSLFNSGMSLTGTLTFTDANIEFVSTGMLAANTFVGNPGDLSTGAGSLVRFNQFTEVSPTSATFNGSLAIGFDTDPSGLYAPATNSFNPSAPAWNIAENLIVYDETYGDLVIDDGVWNVGGNFELGRLMTVTGGGYAGTVTLQNNATMSVGGNVTVEGPLSTVIVEDTATLNITGNVTIDKGGRFIYRDDRKAEYVTYSIAGAQTVVDTPPVGPPYLIRGSGGSLTFEDTASAGDATVILEGGAGDDAPGGLVVFRGDSSAGDTLPLARALFRTKGSRFGPTLPPGYSMRGHGGEVRFEGTSGASNSTFINEGCQDSVSSGGWQYGGTGGRTIFANNSSAEQAEIHNHGASTTIALLPLGGVTQFRDNSTAGSATITNHADGKYYIFDTLSGTSFFESSNAGTATIENQGSPSQSKMPGRTDFRGNSSAANATIHNRAHLTVGDLAGRTTFYDSATAANATINMYGGYSDDGRVEFHNQSTAGNATIVAHNIPTVVGRPNNGGRIFFYNNSTAAQSQITLRQGGSASSIQFHNNATAASAQIVTEQTGGNIAFLGSSTAASATMSLGRSSLMSFFDQSKAENADITLAHGAQVQFQNHSSAGQANIVAAGSSLYPWAGGTITFNSTSTINNTTITLHGGTVPLGTGATAAFINGAHAGNATITANGGSGGGGGATISFNSGAKGDTARLIANAGATVDFLSQNLYGGTSVGSIEGAGTYILRGSHLTTGTRNTSTTVSGAIIEGSSSGGRLTKVGTGTLTLAGTNTYTGLTTVNAGAVSVTGSITGGAVVNNGGTLGGTGSIGGLVTVQSGAHLAPGTSIGTITMAGGLTTNVGSILDFELGPPSSGDKINVTLAGVLTLNGGTVNLTDAGGLGAGTYTLIDYAGTLGGAVGNVALGTQPAGFSYSLVNNAGSTSIDLMVTMAGVPGDYNNNGSVDAADYVLWRNDGPLANEVDSPGTVNGQDYTEWRSRFGNPSSGGGSGAAGIADAAVPEPANVVLLLIGLLASCCRRRTGVS